MLIEGEIMCWREKTLAALKEGSAVFGVIESLMALSEKPSSIYNAHGLKLAEIR